MDTGEIIERYIALRDSCETMAVSDALSALENIHADAEQSYADENPLLFIDDCYLLIGQVYYKLGLKCKDEQRTELLKKAGSYFENLIRQFHDRWDAFNNLSDVCIALGMNQEARECKESAIQIRNYYERTLRTHELRTDEECDDFEPDDFDI